jgi:DNA-binding transcriptional regulator of glucitol operon
MNNIILMIVLFSVSALMVWQMATYESMSRSWRNFGIVLVCVNVLLGLLNLYVLIK